MGFDVSSISATQSFFHFNIKGKTKETRKNDYKTKKSFELIPTE